MEFYLDRAGGTLKDAEDGEIMVFRVNGELVRAGRGLPLGPGDVIVVPTKAIVSEPDMFERFLSVLQAVVNGFVLSRVFN